MMRRSTFALALVALTTVSTTGFAADAAKPAPGSLTRAVVEFNKKAILNATGKTQAFLTDDEVVAAIRGWIRTTPVSDEVYKAYQGIAESGELPAGASLSFMTTWTGYRGFAFDVWWIDLSIPTKRSSYRFRIRDHKLGSHKLTEEELQRLKEFRRLFPPAPKKIKITSIDTSSSRRPGITK